MIMCTCVPMLGDEHLNAGADRGQKRALNFLELESQMGMSHLEWVLETKLGSFKEQGIFLPIELSL